MRETTVGSILHKEHEYQLFYLFMGTSGDKRTLKLLLHATTHKPYFTWILFHLSNENYINNSVQQYCLWRQYQRILEWKEIWELSLALLSPLIKLFPRLRTFLPQQTHLVNSDSSFRLGLKCHFLRSHPVQSQTGLSDILTVPILVLHRHISNYVLMVAHLFLVHVPHNILSTESKE